MGGSKNNSFTKEVWKSLAYSGLKKVFISPWHISIIAWESMNDLTQRYAEWVHLMHTLITQLGRGLLKVLVSRLTIFFKYVPTKCGIGPYFLCWISGVVPFNTWLISSWEENNVVTSWANAQNGWSCHFEWN